MASQQDIRKFVEVTSQMAQLVTNYYFELKQLGHSDKSELEILLEHICKQKGLIISEVKSDKKRDN